jgi:glycine cleavage system aminomethyltransferase T
MTAVGPRSALQELHLARGAVLETRAGWPVPIHYGDAAAEIAAAREAVAVGEVCGVGIFDLIGPGLDGVAAAWEVSDTLIGAADTFMLSELDRLFLATPLRDPFSVIRWCRLTRDQARLLVGPGSKAPPVASDAGITLTDLSGGFTALVVIGPASPDLLARLVRVDLDPRVFADRRLAITGAAGIPLMVLRWDRSKHLAWELLVGRDVAEYFVELLEHAGEDLGLRWIGVEAVAAVGEG